MAESFRPPGGGGAGGEGLGRSRGGFTTKLHLSEDGSCRPLSLIVTPGQRADCTQFIAVMEEIRVPRLGPGRPRVKPESLAADKACSNGLLGRYLRRRGIRHAIPEKTDSQAAPPPQGCGLMTIMRRRRQRARRRSRYSGLCGRHSWSMRSRILRAAQRGAEFQSA
ncbi:transposase [Streptomyces sp. NPDC056549]|uniref:transposase n=1 Tax=Streptomyces sp. NPDC056549 TaxID=3345864 RepID=UPI00369BC0E4